MSGEIFRSFIPVVKSDTTVIPRTVGLYIGGTGDVTVVNQQGLTATFSSVPAGMTLWIEVVQVKSTGTTATNILALR